MFGLFYTILGTLIPLYFSILFGFFLGKFFESYKSFIVFVMFYFIAPVIIFTGVMEMSLDYSILSLPLLIFFFSCFISLIFYKAFKSSWKDSSGSLLALFAGTGNAGYFGLPIALSLFDPQTIGKYIVAIIGMILFEYTLGFYLNARNKFTSKSCFKKVVSLPTLHAFFLAVIFKFFDVSLANVLVLCIPFFRKLFSFLGMMIIGMSLVRFSFDKVDFKFIFTAFLAKFLVWPIFIFSFIYLDNTFFHLYSSNIHQALILFSIAPLASNPVIIASLLGTHPEKAAASVLFSAIFALLYIPLMVAMFIQ